MVAVQYQFPSYFTVEGVAAETRQIHIAVGQLRIYLHETGKPQSKADNSWLCSTTLDLTQHEFICDSNPIQNSTTTPKKI